MFPQEQEEHEFHHSTPSEWDREEARWIGMEKPDQAWILTGNDVWHQNPFYHGPPVPHPEDDEDDFIGPRQLIAPNGDDIPF